MEFITAMHEYRDAVAQRDAATARRVTAYFAWFKAQRDFQLGLVSQEQETRLQQEYRAADLAEDLATTTTEAARRQACAAAERELRRLLGDAAPAVLLPNLFDLGDA